MALRTVGDISGGAKILILTPGNKLVSPSHSAKARSGSI